VPKPRSSRPPDDHRSSRPPPTIAAPSLDAPKHIDRALELCAQHGASDYHLHSGAQPRMRIDGTLHALRADQRVSELAVEHVLAEVLGDEERMQLTLDGELRVIHQSESGIRARLSAFVSEHGSHLQLHVLPIDVPSAEQLGLGGALSILREKPWGLAICSGPTGSGVTTTLWALAQSLANERARYSVSLESPVELNAHCGVGLFEQREVGRHVESYAAGVAWALAEGADLIVVSDLLAPGAFEASLHAARARCLVIAGMRAGSSFAALRRLLSEAQGDAELLRRSLADGLRMLMHQRLLPRRNAPGSIAAFELVLGGGRLMQHLRRAELLQLAAAFEVSHDPELFTLRDALNDLVRGSIISPDSMRAALGVDRGCLEV
jgi:twitching motility protein PilT